MRNTAAALQKNPPAELALKPLEAERNAPSHAVDERFRITSASAWRGAAGAIDRPVRRILVPTDFSACSFRAVEHAIAMARQCDASLTLLHVIDITPAEASRHQGTANELMQQLRARGTSELARLKSSLEQTQVRIQTGLIEGLPHEVIVENSSAFELLLISEPPAKSAWNFFSKHTARRVIEQAKCPVRVVHREMGLASLDPGITGECASKNGGNPRSSFIPF